jgi:sugar/nucleoside kinase (ribokinase family)
MTERAHSTERRTRALDVISAGEALWDLEAPRGSSFAAAPSLRFSPGGAAVNAAIALARLGLSVGLAAVVGDDALGAALLARVAARGIDVSLAEKGARRTGLVLVERGERGTRVVGYRREDESAPPLVKERARALLVTGVLPGEEQAARFAELAKEARGRGATVVLDLNARPLVWRKKHAAHALAAAGEACVVKASEDDLETLAIDAGAVREAMRSDAVLVVTAGPRAARAMGAFGEITSEPRAIEGASAMGAGDAFTAGMLAALLGGEARWDRVLARAHAAARRRVRRTKS